MKFTSLTTIAATLLLSASALARPTIEARDVYAPPVTYPHAGTVWKVGEHHNVTWDTANHPVNITNGIGQIMLRKAGLTTPVILASEFNILLGRITVTVPWVQNGTDYQLVLFGDSGNFSPTFTITGPASLF
ncbi:hypothetical protein HYPSUDRAFT_137577 [Hypholoma sublateritium FD-334 SS-4]|uniref:Yeast cell wall synthesis Kre9/Knh1-like N-terminal domain-containing protein n=1 Tax=Hypholoma sublateritium (strain FD-334 SS-4) TaxID=945553 RepID=A0A0D2MIY8_HYPSF|nr:hypothetical protein HYPSUDRAFT_137577 [Hypholoma sublateritium FD-334 SS-4]